MTAAARGMRQPVGQGFARTGFEATAGSSEWRRKTSEVASAARTVAETGRTTAGWVTGRRKAAVARWRKTCCSLGWQAIPGTARRGKAEAGTLSGAAPATAVLAARVIGSAVRSAAPGTAVSRTLFSVEVKLVFAGPAVVTSSLRRVEHWQMPGVARRSLHWGRAALAYRRGAGTVAERRKTLLFEARGWGDHRTDPATSAQTALATATRIPVTQTNPASAAAVAVVS